MHHKKIYEWFKLCFPQYDQFVEVWFAHGKNSIRIRQTNGQEFVFTYNSKDDWKFETRKSYANYLKERRIRNG